MHYAYYFFRMKQCSYLICAKIIQHTDIPKHLIKNVISKCIIQHLDKVFNGSGKDPRPGDWIRCVGYREKCGLSGNICGNLNHSYREVCYRSNSTNATMKGHPESREETGIWVTEENLSEVKRLAVVGQEFKEERRRQNVGWGVTLDYGGEDLGTVAGRPSEYGGGSTPKLGLGLVFGTDFTR